ncbi:hypothetical protein [Solitalea canadensis]|uniref:Uncharacterized protein n=1 Tax=Solitalea canadensis (strain ATCC 29591 / DSM 3403 / JCM 21819 / LMG 8368 / NBRC 15130 / NCIMB 12057 / USAM 9D) TaxID=929556 RepID=H8KXY8_SOLCM|nr:hypothetical protein [Solitalea canadensis]AFD05664.1 hypothetical protein Solca_0534 [Solitalea canadensis DSM 3403]
MENNEFENSIPKPQQSSPYTVPKDYFDSLASRIMVRIEMEDAGPTIEGLTNVNPFKTPDDYFNELSTRIENQLKDDDVRLSIPDLNNKNPFTVPDEYFNNLPIAIEEQIFNDIANSEFEQAQKIFVFRFYKLAITACLGALLFWFGSNIYHTSLLDKQMSSPVNVVKIGNHNYDLNYFDESMIIDEVINTKVSQNNTQKTDQNNKLENYILNNVDEDLLLQEL